MLQWNQKTTPPLTYLSKVITNLTALLVPRTASPIRVEARIRSRKG